MLSNHSAVATTSYSDTSDPQSNLELDSLKANNRQLSEDLANTRQELAILLENTKSVKAEYLNLYVKYSRLENLVKANVQELSNFLNEPRPQNLVDQTRRNSRSEFSASTRPQTQKVLKTQLVLPTVKGHVIQVPRITLDRLDNIEFFSNRRTTHSNTDLAAIVNVESSSSDSDTEERIDEKMKEMITNISEVVITELSEIKSNEASTSQDNHAHPANLTSDENQVDNSQLSDYSNQEENLFGSESTDVEVYLSRLISAQDDLDQSIATIPDNMENMRIVLERLPTNHSLGPLLEEPSDSNSNNLIESSSTNTDMNLALHAPSTSSTDVVDSTTGMQQHVSDPQLSGPGCSSSSNQQSSITNSKKFSSLSQLAAMQMLGLGLTTSSPKLRRRRKKSSPQTTQSQQKNRKRKLSPKCSSPSIRKKRISDNKIIMVLLDRKEISKLVLFRNPVVRIRRMLDNKTTSKTESKSVRKKMTERNSSSLDSRTNANSEVGSQSKIGQMKKKQKNRQNEVVSEAFIKRNLSVKVTKLKALK